MPPILLSFTNQLDYGMESSVLSLTPVDTMKCSVHFIHLECTLHNSKHLSTNSLNTGTDIALVNSFCGFDDRLISSITFLRCSLLSIECIHSDDPVISKNIDVNNHFMPCDVMLGFFKSKVLKKHPPAL